MEGKFVKDPIHGMVMIPKYLLNYVDTVQFQRLRELKQLGSAQFVFIGATHSRFEHSIGVGHLSGRMVDHLRILQPELEISERDLRCVTLAGTLHDLGHGPFSHIFSDEFLPKSRQGQNGKCEWTHEMGSEMMFDYLVNDNGIDIDTQDLKFVKTLIQGNDPLPNEKQFLYDVVGNKRNGVDVDKFDYLKRDCHYTGILSSYDHERLLINSRVIDNQITWDAKEVFNLYDLFYTRFSLHRRVYTHRVGKAVELMLVDALLAADEHLEISSSIHSPERYLQMTDDIIRDIEKSRVPELAEARDLVWRLRKRYLYKFVDEVRIDPTTASRLFYNSSKEEAITAELIMLYADSPILKQDDIIVSFMNLNYGMRDQNPVDKVRFFNKYDLYQSFHVDKNQVSHLIPDTFQELSVRIFSRNPHVVPCIQQAFRRCMDSLFRQAGFHGDHGQDRDCGAKLDQTNNIAQFGQSSSVSNSPSKNLSHQVPRLDEWLKLADKNNWSPQKPQLPSNQNMLLGSQSPPI